MTVYELFRIPAGGDPARDTLGHRHISAARRRVTRRGRWCPYEV